MSYTVTIRMVLYLWKNTYNYIPANATGECCLSRLTAFSPNKYQLEQIDQKRVARSSPLSEKCSV